MEEARQRKGGKATEERKRKGKMAFIKVETRGAPEDVVDVKLW